MKTHRLDVTRLLSAAVLAAGTIATFSAGGMRTAAAEECVGPFRQCATSVGAVCTRDADGKQRMTYWDYPGKVMMFEQCVGDIFQANGQPNPYTPAGASRGGSLTVPYTELLYPRMPDR